MYRLFQTNNNWIPSILRWMLGSTFFIHGSQKLLGWFGGYGFESTMNYLTDGVGLPWFIGLMVIITEFFGGLLLFIGLATRICAAAIMLLVIGIISMVHWRYGFFMNWEGNQAGEGIEFFLLIVATSLCLVMAGGGRWSSDRFITVVMDRAYRHEVWKK